MIWKKKKKKRVKILMKKKNKLNINKKIMMRMEMIKMTVFIINQQLKNLVHFIMWIKLITRH